MGEASHPGPMTPSSSCGAESEARLRGVRAGEASNPCPPTRRSARLQGVRADHRRSLVVEVAPKVVDATAVDLSDTMDGENDLADSEAVPVFNSMDSDEEDEFDRTVAQSRSMEDAPRSPPDEEFLDHFQQDLLRTRRRVRRRVQDSVSDAPEVGRTDGRSRRPSRRVVLVPGSEEGAPQSIQDRVPSTESFCAGTEEGLGAVWCLGLPNERV